MIHARAAVQYAPGEVPRVQRVELDEPGPGEVLVRVRATGICHTDLSIPGVLTPVPVIPGHEGAGIVEGLGEGVRGLAAGDHVLISFGSCGRCMQCGDGHPHDCERFPEINFGAMRSTGVPGARVEGAAVSSGFFGQSSFSTHAITTPRNLVKVDKALPLDLYAPLGCGIITGAGTVMNALRPEPGNSIAIFGAGPVGLAAVMAARIRGCDPIVVVDLNRSRLELASDLGATQEIDPAEVDTLEVIRRVTNGGADFSVETAGAVETFTNAIDAIRPGGTCGLVTVPQAPFEYAPIPILLGRTLKGVIEGASDPQRFIPELIALHEAGQLPIEKLIRFYDFADFESAYRDAQAGEVVKAVLRMQDC